MLSKSGCSFVMLPCLLEMKTQAGSEPDPEALLSSGTWPEMFPIFHGHGY